MHASRGNVLRRLYVFFHNRSSTNPAQYPVTQPHTNTASIHQFDLLEQMRSERVALNKFTLSSMLKACKDTGRMEEALDLWKDMSAAGISFDASK